MRGFRFGGFFLAVLGRPCGFKRTQPEYFDVLRIPVRQGRPFTSCDDAKSLPVAIINERMAREFWRDGDPLVFAVVPILLTAVALIAVRMPALRPSNVDTTAALRHE